MKQIRNKDSATERYVEKDVLSILRNSRLNCSIEVGKPDGTPRTGTCSTEWFRQSEDLVECEIVCVERAQFYIDFVDLSIFALDLDRISFDLLQLLLHSTKEWVQLLLLSLRTVASMHDVTRTTDRQQADLIPFRLILVVDVRDATVDCWHVCVLAFALGEVFDIIIVPVKIEFEIHSIVAWRMSVDIIEVL